MSNHISSLSGIPRYHRLASILRERIETAEWIPNDLIPSERELIETYRFSRTTVRAALNLLVNEGYIYRRHGQGTFVADYKINFQLDRLMSFSKEMELLGFQAGQIILSFEYIEPSEQVRNWLGLSLDNTRVLCIKRLRLANGEPISIHCVYLALEPDQVITKEELEASGSLYEILESKFSIILVAADEIVEATTAGADEAKLLKVKIGSPLLMMERTARSEYGKIIEFVQSLSRGDRYRCFVRKTR